MYFEYNSKTYLKFILSSVSVIYIKTVAEFLVNKKAFLHDKLYQILFYFMNFAFIKCNIYIKYICKYAFIIENLYRYKYF